MLIPQMSPMSWIILGNLFLFNYMFINLLNYYIFMPSIMKQSSNKMQYFSLNWKW
uniref:ATP synthase F0 subunit 8 n=1 Tax=Culicoides wadai TaxID=469754 RepID=A8B0S0_9DIPT|nr:ATP synthase F0 subunit 8 [Culicoides wadai]